MSATAGRSGAWMLGHHLVRMLLSFTVTLALARHLSPVGFGQYQYVLSLLLVAAAIATLGLQAVVVQRLVDSDRDSLSAAEVLGTALGLRLLGGALVGIPLALYAGAVHGGDMLARGLLWAAPLLIWQAADVLDYLFQARLRGDLVALVRTSALLLSAGGVLVGIVQGHGPIWFLAVAGGEYFLVALFAFFANQRAGLPLVRWRWNSHLAVQMLGDSWPVLLSSVSLYVYLRVDTVMVAHFCDAAEVGHYAASARVAQMAYFLPMVAVNAVFPVLFRLWAQKSPRYAPLLRAAFSLLGLLAWSTTLPIVLLAPWAMPLLFGPDYTPAAALLALHGWTGLFYFIRVGLDRQLVGEGLTKHTLLHHGANALTNIALNLWLIPLYGAWGAALASLLALAFAGVFLGGLHPATRVHWSLTARALLAPWYVVREGHAPILELLHSKETR